MKVRIRRCWLALGALLLAPVPSVALACAPQERGPDDDRSRLLRRSPKAWARFVAHDPVAGTVQLELESGGVRDWPLQQSAEVWVHGHWGRLEQLTPGDRVWAWFDLGADGERRAVYWLADEPSEQWLHDQAWQVVSLKPDGLTVRRDGDGERRVPFAPELRVREEGEALRVVGEDPRYGAFGSVVAPGDEVFLGRRSGSLVWVGQELEFHRGVQRRTMEERWRARGLPGRVSVLHPIAGLAELMLEHEAMRWGRSLSAGDEVEILGPRRCPAVVVAVEAFFERTRVRLAVRASDQIALEEGARVGLVVPEPAPALQQSPYPMDRGRERAPSARVDWILASMYCACSIGGDGCTGMVATLASCSESRCGMPRKVRSWLGEWIAEGWSDQRIFEELERRQGPLCLRPHIRR